MNQSVNLLPASVSFKLGEDFFPSSDGWKIVAGPSPLKEVALLFSRCAQQSRKLIALSLLSQMKDLGNVCVINRIVLRIVACGWHR